MIKQGALVFAAASLLGAGGVVIGSGVAGAQSASGLVHAQLSTFADAGSGPAPLLLTGAISDLTCIDTQGQEVDSVQCVDGSFMIDHSAAPVAESFKMAGCTGFFTALVPYTIFDGTGRFVGISGQGLASVSSQQTQPSSGGVCDFNAAPVSGSTLIWTSFIASFGAS